MYFAHINLTGPVKYGQLPRSIGVHDSLDDPKPIGKADCKGWALNGLAVWSLTILGQPIDGLWVIIDRGFKPAGKTLPMASHNRRHAVVALREDGSHGHAVQCEVGGP